MYIVVAGDAIAGITYTPITTVALLSVHLSNLVADSADLPDVLNVLWVNENAVSVVGTVEIHEGERLWCFECGTPMILDDNEVSHHVDGDDQIDYDADGDHVAYGEVEHGLFHVLVLTAHAGVAQDTHIDLD